jgi:hypothetical protein
MRLPCSQMITGLRRIMFNAIPLLMERRDANSIAATVFHISDITEFEPFRQISAYPARPKHRKGFSLPNC